MSSRKQDVSNSEVKFIVDGCRDNCRQDGRGRSEYRSYIVVAEGQSVEMKESMPLVLSQGSARVFLVTGETHVLVSVKAELVRPAAENPNHGVVNIHADVGTSRSDSDELESILANLLVPHLLETSSLCLVPSLYAWKLNIDILVLDSDGGSLLEACSLGINRALLSTVLPDVTFCPSKDGEKGSLQLDSDYSAGKFVLKGPNPPSIITATMLKSPAPIFILDATKAEQACAVAQIHMVVDVSEKTPKICAVQTSGKDPLSLPAFQDATSFVLESASRKFAVSSTGSSSELLLQSTFEIQQSLSDQ